MTSRAAGDLRPLDVLVLGGGPAGTAAALQLGRMRRRVLVLDSGHPRNAPAAHLHGYPGHDGTDPAELRARIRTELERYGVQVRHDHVNAVSGDRATGFTATGDGGSVRARRVLLATGITDEPPDVPGVAENWGRLVVHCPYCHGWEVRDGRTVVLDSTGLGTHQALLFSQLTDRVTLIVHDGPGPDADQARQLEAAGVTVLPGPVTQVRADHGELDGAVVLADGTRLPCEAVVVGGRFHANVDSVTGMRPRLADHPTGLGRVVDASSDGRTSVEGLYAAGNVTDPAQQVLHAAAHGSLVAGAINLDLRLDDVAAAGRSRTDAARWDARYRAWSDAGLTGSGHPNGTLVVEVTDLPAGRALDVGCGLGADAIWLAAHGWDVTAVDIAATAVEHARRAGAAAGVRVAWQCRDVLAEPPEPSRYDLVSIQYPALLRAAGPGPVRALLDAVAPGGTLLVVGHRPDPDLARRHGFEPDDYVSPGGLAAMFDERFTVETDEVRPRPHPPAGNPHTHDTVLRARRRPGTEGPPADLRPQPATYGDGQACS